MPSYKEQSRGLAKSVSSRTYSISFFLLSLTAYPTIRVERFLPAKFLRTHNLWMNPDSFSFTSGQNSGSCHCRIMEAAGLPSDQATRKLAGPLASERSFSVVSSSRDHMGFPTSMHHCATSRMISMASSASPAFISSSGIRHPTPWASHHLPVMYVEAKIKTNGIHVPSTLANIARLL